MRSIRCFCGNGHQFGVVAFARQHGCSGPEELAKMAHHVKEWREINVICGRVHDHRRNAPIFEPIGAALAVEHHVPIDPAVHPMVQASDDVAGIPVDRRILGVQVFFLGFSPRVAPVRRLCAPIPVVILPNRRLRIAARLRLNQEFIGSCFVSALQGRREIVMRALVPMDCGAVEILRAFCIAVHDRNPLIQSLPVLVIAQHIQVSQAIFLQGRAQMQLHKFRHLLRRVEHALPIVSISMRLIFDRKAPNRKPLGFIRIGVLDKKLGPCWLHFWAQMPSNPGVIVLHPRRSGPRRGDDAKAIFRNFLCSLHHGDEKFPIRLNAEMLQIHIPFHWRITVLKPREITRVHVRSRQ